MPKNVLQLFDVTGRGAFPYDMLRYDQCWPYSSVDSSRMEGPEERTVTMATHKENYTPERWRSFVWTISSYQGG